MNVTGTVILLEEIQIMMPGDSAVIQIILVTAAPISEGLKFVMREGNLTIGAGVITKLIN